jgi:hypothetical protein
MDGIEFLRTILVASPAARPAADVALQHPWLLPDDDYIESFPRPGNKAANEDIIAGIGSNSVPRRDFKGARRGPLDSEKSKKASVMRSARSCAACYIGRAEVS